MACRLIVAPAAAGKTAFALELARRAASGLASTPVVVVATYLQATSCRRRLAQAGGTLGVRVMTFYGLYAECLEAAGKAYIELAEPVRYRLIRAVVDALPLKHYAPLIPMPGFVQVLAGLIAELKMSLIAPRSFTAAVDAMGAGARLAELAQIYGAYLDLLQSHGWSDGAGVGWLALAALETGEPQAGPRWPMVVVDGFDDFSPLELALLNCTVGAASLSWMV